MDVQGSLCVTIKTANCLDHTPMTLTLTLSEHRFCADEGESSVDDVDE